MKKIFYSGLTAMMMLLIMAGFVRAATPQLTFTGISSDNKFGRYYPIVATLTMDGTQQQNFEVYYCTGGGIPSKAAYVPGAEESTGFYRVIASGTTAEIMLTGEMYPYFKAIAYPAGTSTASNLVQLDLTALNVEQPEFESYLGIGAVDVDVNTVIRITDNAGGAEIFYSTDATTEPLKSAWEQNNPKVFKYDDATGIKITQAMTIWAIAFKEVNGVWGGSTKLRKRFNLTKPTIKIAFSPRIYTIGEAAPIVSLTIPEGVTLGTQPGNVAIQLTCEDNDFSQLITENGVALDMSKADAASHEDEWTIRATLVKGNNPSVEFTGEIGLTPEVIGLEILKNGERPAKPVFSVPSGKVYSGTKVAITCATPGATIYYTSKDDEINVLYKGEITITKDISFRAMAEKDGLSSYRDGVVQATYTIAEDPLPALTATVAPAAGSLITEGTEITVTPSTTVDKICFKLYGKAEDVAKDNNFNATATEYSETVKPVPTQEKPIVRVGLVKNGTWKYFSYFYIVLPGVPWPVFSPVGGAVPEGTEVGITLSQGSVEATIYYTTNDSVPQVGKPFTQTYTQKIVVNQAMTIKAIAVTGEGESSKMVSATYTIRTTPVVPDDTVDAPVFSRVSGQVEKGTKIGLFCPTSGAAIHYTLNGAAPTATSALYSDSIEINATTTVKAIAVKDGWVDSKVAEATYTVPATPVVPPAVTLTFDPASGSTVDDGTAVSISASDRNAEIVYMMFSSEKEARETEWNENLALPYMSEMKPALSTEQTTIKATYTLDGETLADTFFYATYIVNELQALELSFSPASGSVVEDGAEIKVVANQETEIFYVVYADSVAAVTASSIGFILEAQEVSEDGNPVITKGSTYLRCGAFDKSVGMIRYFYASYKIKGEEPVVKADTVATPEFSLPSGEVEKGTKVAISCATEDARIYYTLNGEEPSLISIPYSDSIVINGSMTLKAIAFKVGMVKSKVGIAAYTYTVKPVVANETGDLAGVSIYPNPNHGQFRISVPVDAQAEVFTVGGQLVERAALSAGANTLRVENSGLYFVRVRANGQVVIRKVFVY